MAVRTARRTAPLLANRAHLLAAMRSWVASSFLIAGALLGGTLGYHEIESMPWPDALLNASMILTGMGPVDPLHTTAGKVFASAYAMFSGVFFLTMVALLFGPWIGRALHRFHVALEEDDDLSTGSRGELRTAKERFRGSEDDPIESETSKLSFEPGEPQ